MVEQQITIREIVGRLDVGESTFLEDSMQILQAELKINQVLDNVEVIDIIVFGGLAFLERLGVIKPQFVILMPGRLE